MKYYYAPGTIALAPHIALEMSGVSYQAIAIDLKAGQQRSAEYLAVNPLGRVPALLTGQGVITEAPAILNYVCNLQNNPNSPLALPNSIPAYFRSSIDSFNSYLSSTVHVAHAHLWRAERWASSQSAKDEMAQQVPLNMIDCFKIIENDLLIGPWVHGEQMTSSDLYLFVMTRWLPADGVDPRQFSHIYSHYQRMLEITEVKNLVAGLYK